MMARLAHYILALSLLAAPAPAINKHKNGYTLDCPGPRACRVPAHRCFAEGAEIIRPAMELIEETLKEEP